MEYFKYLGSMINGARCIRQIIPRFAMAKAAFNEQKTLHTNKKEKPVNSSCYRPGVVQWVGRVIALLFHDRDTRRG